MSEVYNLIQDFEWQVRDAAYPKKCLRCVYEGFQFCRFWSQEFQCESFDKVEMLQRLELLLARG